MDLLNVIIFSKDRAAQLDALLRSIREQVEGWEKRSLWTVVYLASTPEFDQGYEIVRAEHRSDTLRFIDERSRSGDFKSIVIGTMRRQHQTNGAPWSMFLVDDIIFKTPWPLEAGKPMHRLETDPRVLCLSLRMCPRYDHCYSENRPVKPPATALFGYWNWRKASGDWGYPMSVDGHVFRYADIFPLVQQIEFKNPNTFEFELSRNPITPRPLMTCYTESVVVNLPVNRVQHQFKNRAGEEYGVSAEELNTSFLAGRRVDLAPIYALKENRACHHELPLQLLESGTSRRRVTQHWYNRIRDFEVPFEISPLVNTWLLRCIDPAGLQAFSSSGETLSAAQVRRLLEKAASHRVLPMVLQNFPFPAGEAFASLRENFNDVRIEQLALSAMLNQHASRLLNATAGLPVAIVKGQVFAEAIYPNAALRPFTDIDLLAAPEVAAKLDPQLLELGFIKGSDDARRLEAKWIHSKTGALLELHCNLVHSSRMRRVFSLEYGDIGDHPYSRSTQLVVAVAHGAMHYFAWLRHVVDVCQAARAMRADDETRLQKILEQTGLRIPALVGLTLAAQLMRDERCQEIANAIGSAREGVLVKLLRGGAVFTATNESWIVYNGWRRFIFRELLRLGAGSRGSMHAVE